MILLLRVCLDVRLKCMTKNTIINTLKIILITCVFLETLHFRNNKNNVHA